ncbi:MAG: DUF6033 family protein [Bacteroides sp.]|nr:DUF6033 family protein [Eubacterium sp.]MCM1419406.1 DUF6033 family protein [Roseburia sp.]MCM1463238.1 DUF6033 family protein [Bacteroides sp.]
MVINMAISGIGYTYRNTYSGTPSPKNKESGVTETTVELKTSTGGVKTDRIRTGYDSVGEYSSYLKGKYAYMNAGTTPMEGVPTTVSVSGTFLKQCMSDPEKAKYLEENLAALPDCAKSAVAASAGTLTSLSFQVDENGNITMISSGSSDPDGKIARENAARKAREQKAEEERAAKSREEKATAESRQAEKASASPKRTAADELAYLSKKYDGYRFFAMDYTYGMKYGSSSTVNVAISPKFLEKMANDPELAAEYEKNIAAMKDCDERFRQMQAARGWRVEAQGWIIDKDGGIGGWTVTVKDDKKSYLETASENAEKIRNQNAQAKREKAELDEKRKEARDEKERIMEKFRMMSRRIAKGEFNTKA